MPTGKNMESMATPRTRRGKTDWNRLGHMGDAEIRKAAKADLVRRRGDYKYVAPIPPEIKQPPGIPAYLRKDGSDEILSEVKSET